VSNEARARKSVPDSAQTATSTVGMDAVDAADLCLLSRCATK
jgi:hypothetical protein